jgi:ankyrin repeat protein
MIAAKKNQTDVIEFLRAHGADVSTKNAFGEDALHFATLRDNKGAMELLLSFGAETEPEASGH